MTESESSYRRHKPSHEHDTMAFIDEAYQSAVTHRACGMSQIFRNAPLRPFRTRMVPDESPTMTYTRSIGLHRKASRYRSSNTFFWLVSNAIAVMGASVTFLNTERI